MKLLQKTSVALTALTLLFSTATVDAATNLRAIYKGPNFVALLWDYSPGENNNTVYNLYRDGALIYTGASYGYTDYTLTACTNYTFTVAPKYGGASPVSLTVKTNCL
uniref:Fibronectin type-III domain-containing protein n=2 Tax=Paenibacillus athensensis TaxID=1967502 RepID=A0A4Y8Q0B1_9BACL